MGKTLRRGIDGYSDKGRKNVLKQPEKVGEDFENVSKKEGVAHKDTWKYKLGWVDSKILARMLKKHVGEPYGVLYAEIAKKYKTGSLERLHIERDLVWMSKETDYLPYNHGYFIDADGIIRYAQKVAGEVKVIK
jgi:hypothetical protein